jgi:purine-binding chemotaxis protein CheW
MENSEVLENSEEQVIQFRLGPETFATGISNIIEILKPIEITPVPNARDFILGVINLRGKIVLIIDLSKKIGFTNIEQDKDSRIIVIEDENNEQVGLLVNAVSETIKIDKTRLQPTPPIINKKIDQKFIKGIYNNKNNLVIYINIKNLIAGESNGR